MLAAKAQVKHVPTESSRIGARNPEGFAWRQGLSNPQCLISCVAVSIIEPRNVIAISIDPTMKGAQYRQAIVVHVQEVAPMCLG